jgi:F-type H+-transporting ATPase subunit epsilon
MQLEIISPEQTIFSGEVSLVQLPGIDGSFEILNNHAPLISVFAAGKVKIEDSQKQTKFFDIKGGVVEVLHNKVLVLAE